MSEFKKFFETIPRHLKGPRPNHIGNSLITPGIEFCNIYRRNTGWFRQSSISIYVPAIEKFLENKNSKIRMLASLTGKVNQDVFKALEKTKDEKKKKNILLKYADRTLREQTFLIADPDNWTYQNHLLLYLLAKNKLEIRFAISRPFGTETPQLFHEKAGYFKFQNNEELAFLGNFNESKGSIVKHGERVQVFTSLIKERPNDDDSNLACYFDDSRDIKYYIEELDSQWKGLDEGTEVHKVNDHTLQEIKKYSLSSSELKNLRNMQQKVDIEKKDKETIQVNIPSIEINIPKIPKIYKGNKLEDRKHQKNALINWDKSGYKGIFDHATGSGKTLTSIIGLCKLAKKSKTIAIVGVPYQSLADQWVDEFTYFNVDAIKCYKNRNDWEMRAQQALSKFKTYDSDKSYLLTLVVVNKTLKSKAFQNLISEIDPEDLVFIGDECHRYGSENGTKNLPNANYRLGLSATPFSDNIMDEKKNKALENYFGKPCDTFSLKEALKLKVLCDYRYHIFPTHLTEDEFEAYNDHASKLFLGGDSKEEINMSQASAMGRILGSAKNKFKIFEDYLEKNNLDGRALIFCGDGSTDVDDSDEITEYEKKDIMKAFEILKKHKIRSRFFTYAEVGNKRKQILEDFNNNDVQSLISIRVLDEGIDIPGVESAFLLASSRNRRQFIQRRGRVLRKSKNKKFANIYDFLCLPPRGIYKSSIVGKELERIAEINDDCIEDRAKNIKLINDIISEYKIDDDKLEKIQKYL